MQLSVRDVRPTREHPLDLTEMANRLHLSLLRSGADAWNEWRRSNPRVRPNLKKAKLISQDLTGYNFHGCDFSGADLSGAMLHLAHFGRANLHGTNFQGANLHTATLSGAEINAANFVGAIVIDADLTFCEIEHTCFSEARLQGSSFAFSTLRNVTFCRADLQLVQFNNTYFIGVDLTGAAVGATSFGDTSFVDVKGLDTLRHEFPSSIGIDTFFNAGGLPQQFLSGAGVPDEFIEYAGSLLGKPIEYYSCFISYSSHDDQFARRLHADLQARSIRTWFAPEDLKVGDRFRSRIDESIRLHEKLVLVLSQAATESPWVEKEVETAFARERRERQDVLFPIRLDDSVFETQQAWAADIVNTRHIGDFLNWKDHDNYIAALDRLVRDLKKTGPMLMH